MFTFTFTCVASVRRCARTGALLTVALLTVALLTVALTVGRARGIGPETFGRRGQLSSCPPATGPPVMCCLGARWAAAVVGQVVRM